MIIIIQTGSPVGLAKQYGSFADWFVSGMVLEKHQFSVFDVHMGQKLPVISEFKITGIVITGSASMITEQQPWMMTTMKWLEQAFKNNIPVLGVCFGHQMIADMLGGKVDYNPKGRSMGVSQFEVNEKGRNDVLFSYLNPESKMNIFVSHQQSITKLPEQVELLGSSNNDPHHAFRSSDFIWGVQFHPEWDVLIMQAYINQRKNELINEGYDPDSMINQLTSCNKARMVLKNFISVAHKNH